MTDRITTNPPLPNGLDLEPVSRRPCRLSEATLRAIEQLPPPQPVPQGGGAAPASIVMATYNNGVFTKLCLASLLGNTDYSNYEVVVVDNASTDGTREYLRELADRTPQIQLVLNDSNRGFAAAMNQAIAATEGQYIVLLNNDTIVPPGWLGRLLRHVDDEAVGLVGPVTNRTCNEAQVDAPYRTYAQMVELAARRAKELAGNCFDIPMLAMFCTAMRRDVLARIGPLDEQFGVGMFEDEDYAMRVREAGWRVVCAEDVFVHHFGEASFGAMFASGAFSQVFQDNCRRFEWKWNVRWQPHQRRQPEGYDQLVESVRQLVCQIAPAGDRILIVSKGDPRLVELPGRDGRHFPCDASGQYTGHNPADSEQAVAQLEVERASGARFLVIPASAGWWLDYYGGFREHLDHRYRRLDGAAEIGVVFDLRQVREVPS